MFLALTAFASAQIPSYNVINLGTLGGPGAAARGINNNSEVAGQSAVGSRQHAFRWKEVPAVPPPGTVAVLTDLGVLSPALDSDGINIAPSGIVVGQSHNPAKWDAVAAIALPALGADNTGNAHAATSRTVAGYLTRYIPGWGIVNSRAVKWHKGAASELHPVDATLSQAFDINRDGVIAGWASATAFGQPHAMRWSGGVATDVHGGFTGKTLSNGFALNASGTVVGMAYSTSPAVDAVPFRSPGPGPGDGMILLPLPAGTPRGRALDINADGYVVGFGEPGTVAMLWLPDTTPVVLQDRIPAGTGWTLRAANAINDHGEIAGWGIISGQTRAFLLRPTTYHPGAVKTELLDPANPEPEPDPGYPLLTDGGITTDKPKLAAFGQAAVGLVADGTTRLVLRITTSDAGTVTVSIPGPGDDEPATGVPARDGWVGPTGGGKPDASSMTVSTTNVSGKNMAFAVYRAPEELPPEYNNVATAPMSLKVRFDGPSGTDPAISYVAVRVDRPPVIVMHGLYSNPIEAFGDFRYAIKNQMSGLRVGVPSYANAAHFADNKAQPGNQIDWFRADLRKEKMPALPSSPSSHRFSASRSFSIST